MNDNHTRDSHINRIRMHKTRCAKHATSCTANDAQLSLRQVWRLHQWLKVGKEGTGSLGPPHRPLP